MNQARKKALFLITKATWGGAQKYTYDLATHLSSAFEVSVAYGVPGKLSRDLEKAGIKTHRLPSLGRDLAFVSDVASFFQMLALLLRERPDVLHLNSSKAAGLGALAARICGITSIVFTVHGWPFKERRGVIAAALIYYASMLTALMSTAVIVVSKEDERRVEHIARIRQKTRYIPLGAAMPALLSREEAAGALSISAPRPRIVTVAELTKNKGIEFAIDAVAELKKRGMEAHYFIIGDGELRAELAERARRHGIADRVRFLGFVENAAAYLKAFDLFVLPSLKEGMPYALIEAAAAGVPSITTDAVEAEANVSVEPGSARALTDAIFELTEAPPALSSRAPGSLEAMVRATLKCYPPVRAL